MSTLPLVTIITPTYNRAAFLEETIESVLTQGYPNLEYIVLDDGSKDNTLQILEKYRRRLYFESHPNMGETRTVNKAFTMARGEIICVVNSDDPLLPGAIAAAVAALQERPEALAAYSDWREIGPKSEPIHDNFLPTYDLYNMLGELNVMMGPGTFFRRRAFDLIGLRTLGIKYTGDLDYWHRLALHGPLVHIPRVLATHRTHPDAASTTDRGAAMADEVVDMIARILADPKLPPDLRRQRRCIMARMLRYARAYCGADSKTRRRYLWRAVRSHPGVVGPMVWENRYFKPVRWSILEIRCRAVMMFKLGLLMVRRAGGGRLARKYAAAPGAAPKFAVVSCGLPPSWSGQSVILGRILRGIDPNAYCLISVKNFSSNDGAADFTARLPAEYNTLPWETRLPNRPIWLARLARWLRVIERGCNIALVLRAKKCAAVIVATGDVIDPPAACFAARITGAAYYPYLFDDYTYQWIEPDVRAQAKRFEAVMVRHAAGAIAPNELMQETFERRHGLRPALVRNVCAKPVDHSPPPTSAGTLPDPARPVHVLYTGAVYHVNTSTFRAVLAALAQMPAPGAQLHLYTAQTPKYLAAEGIISPQTVLHWHAPHEEIEQAQRAGDMVLIPFAFNSPAAEIIRTANPGKLGDYLASGTPILAVVPGDCFVARYLREHDCGLVVESDDPALIAAAILRLARDVDLRRRLSANARACAAADFDPAAGREALLHLLGKAS